VTAIFTNFVRSVDPENTISPEVIAEVRNRLVAVLKKRGLYQKSPSLLGYSGARWDSETENDLAMDCYAWAILEKLEKLREYLIVEDSIDAVVVRNIGNFVWEKQKQQDPIGHVVFCNLRKVLPAMVDAGQLHRIHEDRNPTAKDTSETEFQFTGAHRGSVADVDQLKDALLSTGLMFDSLQSFCHAGVKAQEALLDCLSRFQGSIFGFSLGGVKTAICSLIAESKASGAAGRPGIVELSENFPEISRTEISDGGYEKSEWHEKLRNRVHTEIDASRRSTAVKSRMHKLNDLVADVESGKGSAETLAVESLQMTLGVERTTVYEDFRFLASLRERVSAEEPN
jgi:hypothetical protein